MKRLAIIIGSPLKPQNPGYLRGVKKDIGNFYNFLKSSVGGAYREHEIFYLENPTKSQLEEIKQIAFQADIVTIFYSGHGGMKKGQDFFKINSKEIINVKELFTKAKRQLIFIDACRTDYDYDHFDGIGDIGYSFDLSETSLARQLYNSYIQKSPLGGVITFSASPNQSSIDTEDGGVYTISLLNVLLDWYSSNQSKILTHRQAFVNTYKKMQRNSNTQLPRQYFIGNKSALNIPFALKVSMHKKYPTEASIDYLF